MEHTHLNQEGFKWQRNQNSKRKKRQQLVLKYAQLRKELKEKGDYEALQKLPRDSSPTRLKTAVN